MPRLLNDLKYSFRTLSKKPAFAIVVILTLALGIGANTTIFTVVNAYLLRPLPFSAPERLVSLTDLQPPNDRTPASFPEFDDWRKGNQVFTEVAGQFPENLNLIGRREPQRVQGALVSENYFSMLGVQPVAGRIFQAEEHRAGANPAVVISAELWRHEFNGASDVIGKSITLNQTSYTVVGVVDSAALKTLGPRNAALWLPLERAVPYTQRGTHFLQVIARLKPGVGVEQARSDLKVLAHRLDAQYKTGHGITVAPLREQLFGNVRLSLLLLLGASGFLLLIATANVANILLARASARAKEFAIRAALGAGRGRLISQTLAESLLLSSLGGLAGFLLALWGSDLLRLVWPPSMPRPESFSIDWRVLSFLVLASLLSGALFGLAPALQISMSALNETLKDGWSQPSSSASGRLRSALVVSEIAVAALLLVGSGLLLRSFARVLAVDPGFHAENVLTMDISLPSSKYKTDPQIVAFYDNLIGRIRALPGTLSAGAIINLPLGDGGMNGDFQIHGRTFPLHQEPIAEKCIVTPDYFRAMGVRLLRGRLFTEQDGRDSHTVAIINDSLARRFWPNQNPIGKRLDIGLGEKANWQEIVGVVADVRRQGLDASTTSEIYVPHRQIPASAMALVIRSTSDPATLATAVRLRVAEVDKEQPIFNVQTMQEVVSNSLSGRRMSTVLLAAFAGCAMLLASIGIYGVVSYWVSQRTREIGIRSALGARQSDILRLVLGHGMLLAVAGTTIGLTAALALTRFLASLLFGVSSHDVIAVAAAAAALIAVALVASYIPAHRAAKVDPLIALRFE
jgi:putative ABC transport system permease protein